MNNIDNSAKIIGRNQEKNILNEIYKSEKSELVAVYGRRRIGKTFLLTKFFQNKECIFFYCSGIQKANTEDQLSVFVKQIGETFYDGLDIAPQKTWLNAFDILTKAIANSTIAKKIVCFFDEVPWLATRKSNFLNAFDYYWNRHWTQDNRLKCIICGSSASWVIENFINNKGGLYNRITRIIELGPFNLQETSNYLTHRGIKLNNSQILVIYMVFGGIPHYLSLIPKGLSAAQIIDALCFHKNGELVKEFDRLFSSLFINGNSYTELIKIIGKFRYGLSQAKIVELAAKKTGGRLSTQLKNLEEAGFIQEFIPYGNEKKGKYYKVIDEFCLFYLYWIAPNLKTILKQNSDSGYWLEKMQSPDWKSWSGYAFEAVCYKHINEIRRLLKISGSAAIGSWRHSAKNSKNTGCQIDLLFDRNDNAITICEIKYNAKPFTIDKAYAKTLFNKINTFQLNSNSNKQIFMVMITAGGLKDNLYAKELVTQVVTLDDLFQ